MSAEVALGHPDLEWEPLFDKIVVRRDAAKARTEGGIDIPDVIQEQPLMGTVVRVGFGRLMQNGEIVSLKVLAGDRVLFGPYAGIKVEALGRDYLVMREDEVILVFRG